MFDSNQKRVGILQSNYIPWKGYFDIVGMVDEFVFHDDLQYTKNDWRNRNKIKAPEGTKWLTIPCGRSEDRLVCEVMLDDTSWQRKHWSHIQNTYASAPFFDNYRHLFEDVYLATEWRSLSELNQHLIRTISTEILGLQTTFRDSREFNLSARKADRVIELLKRTGATVYLSGPAAKDYLSEEMFSQEKIALEWMRYDGYPTYPQPYPPFEHGVSIVDLLFCTGPDAPAHLKSSTFSR